MVASKTKGQISIEALIIVGVLVIGGVIFASVFLSNISNQTNKANELSGITGDFMNDLEGWNTPDTPIVSCVVDGVCQDPPENTSNCSDCVIPPSGCNNNGYCEASLGETAANCSDCVAPVFISFTISKFVPVGDSAINSKFSLKAQIVSSYPSVEIYDIKLEKYIVADSSWDLSSKCTIKEVAPDTATGIYPGTLLMTIEDVSLKNQGKIIDEITCSEEGEYRFSAMARPKNVAGIPPLSAQVSKIITPAPIGCGNTSICESGETCPTCPECCSTVTQTFSSVIISPTEKTGNIFLSTDTITLSSVQSINPPSTGLTYSCIWKDQEDNILSNNCNDTINASILNPGKQHISLHTSVLIVGANTIKLNASDKTEIEILNLTNPGDLYLSIPPNTNVNENFNVKVYTGTNQTALDNVIDLTHFVFTNTSCFVLNSVTSTSSTTINGQTILYKDFEAKCAAPSYSSCPDVLNPITVTVNQGNNPQAIFTSAYDLSLKSATCNIGASSAGTLNACILTDWGSGYNNFCTQPDGLLQISVNLAENKAINNYGELKIYIE